VLLLCCSRPDVVRNMSSVLVDRGRKQPPSAMVESMMELSRSVADYSARVWIDGVIVASSPSSVAAETRMVM
jgi:hypothetical protein